MFWKIKLLLLLSFLIFVPVKLVKGQSMNPQKTVLILHGWPQPVEKESVNYMYYQYFQNKGYDIVAPKLFTNEFVLKDPDTRIYIEKILNNRKPDVIVGISLGGLLVPQIAKNYPDAKLIFIATDPKMQPEAPGFKIILELAKNRIFIQILNLVKFIPSKVLFAFYEFINPFKGEDIARPLYLIDMQKNFKYMLNIPVSEEEEIVNFVSTTDNTGLLKTLKNKALIFSGNNDLMMPVNSQNSLHKLLINSQEIISNGGHFEVFTNENFRDLDKFLLEK